MAGKRLYITIDTEMDADIHWKKIWPPEYTSIYEGIPRFFRPMWDKYGIHPIYFLSPEILMDDKCCEIFKNEIKEGAVIGAHLHPEYIEPEIGYEMGRQTKTPLFPCHDCSYEVEKAKLENLTKRIEKQLGVRPVWYRAARFGADEDTYKILDELGYKYDSSVTPGIDWSDRGGVDYSDFSKENYIIEGTKIKEIPVTVMGKRWSFFGRIFPDRWLFYRWLRPTHMTFVEMKNMIKEVENVEEQELVMMFHSMEIMIKKTPYVRSRFMQKYFLWRLDKILSYAKKAGYKM